MDLSELPTIRRSNLLLLFSEFVKQRMAAAPSDQINGLDREFSTLVQVHNTYFSGMKSGARTIGDKLARQIETHCQKGSGWLDEPHEPGKPAELKHFLELAERVYVKAPGQRKNLIKTMRDIMRLQKNISPDA